MPRDKKGRFVKAKDTGDSGSDTDSTGRRHASTPPKPLEVVQVQDREDYDKDFPPAPGLTLEEGATEIGDILAAEGEFTLEGHSLEDLEGDPEKLQEATRRLRETGNLEDAAEAIEALGELEAEPDPDGEDAEDVEVEDGGELPEALDLEAYGDRPVTVKVDGEEITVPLSEAVRGFQRQADYTRKTQELANQRRELDGALQATQQRLELLGQAADALSPQQRQVLEAAYGRVLAEREAVRAHVLETEILPAESAKLRESLGWEAPEDVQAGKEFLAAAAVDYGFQPEDLSAVTDHRLLVLLHDAGRYRELRARQREVRQEVKALRRKTKVLKPGDSNTPRGASSAKAKAEARDLARLRETGSVRDAARAISHLID